MLFICANSDIHLLQNQPIHQFLLLTHTYSLVLTIQTYGIPTFQLASWLCSCPVLCTVLSHRSCPLLSSSELNGSWVFPAFYFSVLRVLCMPFPLGRNWSPGLCTEGDGTTSPTVEMELLSSAHEHWQWTSPVTSGIKLKRPLQTDGECKWSYSCPQLYTSLYMYKDFGIMIFKRTRLVFRQLEISSGNVKHLPVKHSCNLLISILFSLFLLPIPVCHGEKKHVFYMQKALVVTNLI